MDIRIGGTEMKKYRLTDRAKERYMVLAWIAIALAGGLFNTWLGC